MHAPVDVLMGWNFPVMHTQFTHVFDAVDQLFQCLQLFKTRQQLQHVHHHITRALQTSAVTLLACVAGTAKNYSASTETQK